MSFIKALPLSERSFDNYALFAPLYNTVKSLFARESIIPCKSGRYVSAKCAKIARQEKLATLFTDELLTALLNDGEQYHWLPTYLTETNKEYEAVYKYLTSELRINLIRPEDLRLHFSANPAFLPQQSEDWIVELYSILENVGAAFSKAKNENNMLVANIIKTSKGQFVAAYRKTENKQYIPNVFLPSGKIKSEDIHFVDSRIYDRCRHFFDNILQLQKPNEYEFFVKDIKKRYSENYSFAAERHIDDLSHLYKYLKYEEYRDEIRGIINDCFLLKCNDGQMRNAYSFRLFLPVSQSGIQIEGYLRNIAKNIFFVDAEFYLNHGISLDALCAIGVQDSLLYNDKITSGQYYTGSGGRQPDWWTSGDFRWKMTMEYVKDAVKYIAAHPSAKDSIIKSKAILSCLMENESKLSGTVYIGGSTPNKENEPCELVRVLRGETMRDWNGKWLYTESMELVSHKHISKHDISTAIYGKVKVDSRIYELLGFRKTEADEVDDLKKSIPQNQLDAFFENELRQRFGITSADLTERYGSVIDSPSDGENDEYQYPFPTAKVKNWDTLKKHAAEMLIFADPVKYDYAVRRIRVSNRPKEARAYLMNMYRYDGLYRYACQLCHDSCSNIEVAQIFNNPEVELDPMNLCLCPNCAAMYRQMRSNTVEMDRLKKQILASREADLSNDDYVSFEVDGQEIWFTQIHIAEIQALLQLEQDVKVSKAPAQVDPDEDDSKDGLSVFDSYQGKQVKRKDGFLGEITKVSDGYLHIKILKGPKAGEETKVQVSWLSSHPGVYEVIQ